MVDWSGASVTPRGFSVSEETLERTQRLIGRPLERTAGGTEINLSQVFLSYWHDPYLNTKKALWKSPQGFSMNDLIILQ